MTFKQFFIFQIVFCVYCVTVGILVVVWAKFGCSMYVCMYVYEDSNFVGFRVHHVYVHAHKWFERLALSTSVYVVSYGASMLELCTGGRRHTGATSYPGHFTSQVGENDPSLGRSVLQGDWSIVQTNYFACQLFIPCTFNSTRNDL